MQALHVDEHEIFLPLKQEQDCSEFPRLREIR